MKKIFNKLDLYFSIVIIMLKCFDCKAYSFGLAFDNHWRDLTAISSRSFTRFSLWFFFFSFYSLLVLSFFLLFSLNTYVCCCYWLHLDNLDKTTNNNNNNNIPTSIFLKLNYKANFFAGAGKKKGL